MLRVNEHGEVKHNNARPHHGIQRQNHKQLIDAFNNILSTMTHNQRAKVQAETEALWVLLNTSF